MPPDQQILAHNIGSLNTSSKNAKEALASGLESQTSEIRNLEMRENELINSLDQIMSEVKRNTGALEAMGVDPSILESAHAAE